MKPNIWRWTTTVALTSAITFVLIVALTQAAQAQTFKVIYNFNHGMAGYIPNAGVTLDESGNLYGTASLSGVGYGAVYKATNRNGTWILSPLYDFSGGTDGAFPESRVVFGPNGNLYGTTSAGGGNGCKGQGCGTVFKLTPSPTTCKAALCPWIETVLYRFQGGTDGSVPGYGDIVFDQAGAIYGTASQGGAYGNGAVYKLTNSGGSWRQSVLYSFMGGSDGIDPLGGVVLDLAGNLYGTSTQTVFELSPSGAGWAETVLHTFQDLTDGGDSESGVIMDNAGNLYGDTHILGPGEGGTVFEVMPSGGSWTFQVLYPFNGGTGSVGSSLIMDRAGNLYGARVATSNGYGEVFELMSAGGSWIHVPLHEFTGGSDGASPYEGVVMDTNGNLYGTASAGGAHGYGVVFEITP